MAAHSFLLAVVALLVCALGCQQAAGARSGFAFQNDVQLRNLLDDAASSGSGTVVNGERLLLSISNLSEHRGAYIGLADQYPPAPWYAFDSGALPDCSAANEREFIYDHYAPDDPHYLILAGPEGALEITTAAHRSTTVFRVISYNNSLVNQVNMKTGVNNFRHWQPFIDLRTGEFKVEIVSGYIWTATEGGPVNYTSINGEIAGNEIPGCYSGPIARFTGADTSPEIKARAAEKEAGDFFRNRPEGSVISISRATYLALNGEVLLAAPKFQSLDAAHEEAEAAAAPAPEPEASEEARSAVAPASSPEHDHAQAPGEDHSHDHAPAPVEEGHSHDHSHHDHAHPPGEDHSHAHGP